MSNGIERIDHGELADISLDDEPIGHTYPRPSSTPEPEKGSLEKIYRVFF